MCEQSAREKERGVGEQQGQRAIVDVAGNITHLPSHRSTKHEDGKPSCSSAASGVEASGTGVREVR